jgi:hypothetical protein
VNYIYEFRDDAPEWVKKLEAVDPTSEYLADYDSEALCTMVEEYIHQPGADDLWERIWNMIEECIGDHVREYLPLPMVGDT